MAAINKSFVIKNGLEVNTNLIFADAPEGKVGIGTTNPQYTLHVSGGIGVTNLYVSGISTTGVLHVGTAGTVITATAAGSVGLGTTNPQYKLQVIGGIGVTDSFVSGVSTVRTELRVGTGGTVLTVLGVGNSIGVGTASPQYLFHINSPVSTGQTALYVQGDVRITGDLSVDDITFDDATLSNLTVTEALNVTSPGISTFGGYVDINSDVDISGTLNVVGLSTFGGYVDINNSVDISNDLNVTGIATIATLNATGIGVTNFTVYNNLSVGGISTFTNGPVLIGSGTSTGTASQTLQVTGGTYVSGNLGIGSTNPTSKLDVIGDVRVTGVITATTFSGNVSAGVGTITTLSSTNGTITNLTGTSGTITNLTGTSGTITTLNSTSGTITTLNSTNGNITNLTGTAGTITNLTGISGTITTFNSTNGNITNLTGTAATIGTVQIVSGIITATSGIVTYYGDGQYLDLTNNPSTGIGIGTTGGVVGYGITFLDLKGAGVSTTQYNSSTGIATIFFEGGGGGGSISISTTAPLLPGSGDLWYSPDYGRTFIYYDENVVGYGTDAFWVDAAPFNVGVITSTAFAPASASAPSIHFAGDVQTGFFSPSSGNITAVSVGSSILNVNPSGIVVTGVITATSFVGNGSGLTGAGSTVFNNTTTNQEFFPLFTATTSGTITASGISTSKLTYNPSTGAMTAVDFNSTSDINLKENIRTVGNALEITEQLRGVSFDWKETGRSSYGVIAQELEEVLPELVKQGEVKSVNYNGIIGVLIEAIKELKKEVEEFKNAK